ncbi:PIN domain-containing protein [soil metagenome]
MTLFVDTSAWYALADSADTSHHRASQVLSSGERLLTTDHVLVETWWLLRSRLGRDPAELFWAGLSPAGVEIEMVVVADLDVALAVGTAFPDQDFSIVDRTSFAVMQRLRLERVVSYDADFAIFRYGAARRRAFTVLR